MNNFVGNDNRRILIIDDNRAIHDDFRKILSAGNVSATALDEAETALFGKPTNLVQKIHYEVDSAYQGQDGLLLVQQALAAGRPYAMAFVDIRMPPGWDGVETTRKIWAINPGIQIVLCTAYADYSWDEMFALLGNSDGLLILKKPFDTMEALQLAQALTEKWNLHRQATQKMEELERLVAGRTTELAKANETLQRQHNELIESKRFLQSTLDSLSSHIAILDQEGAILDVNAAWDRFALENNLTGSHGVGDNYLKICDSVSGPFSEEAMTAANGIRAVIAGERDEFHLEYPCHSAQHQRWFVLRTTRFDNAGLVRVVVAHENITERKRAESLVRRSEERYRSLIDNALDAIFTIAVNGTFTSLNPAVETIAGVSPAEWIDKPFAPMVHPDDLMLANEMFHRILRGEQVPVYELRGHPDLGRPVIMEMTLTAQQDENGKTIGVMGIGRDITGRKKLEARLFQSQKLETVGKLAGGIAHGFNSILTAIIGQSELLLGELPAGSPLIQNATEISKAAGRAATLTRQLLAYGRKQLLQPEVLDLNHIITGMEGMFQLLAAGNIDTQIISATDLQAVKADAGQLEQVIMNMVVNARAAMPNGGKLTLETANLTLDQEYVSRFPELEVKTGRYVMLAITDSGIGMNEEVKARVFEPFFSTKSIGEGTGLGLSTCYGIVKQSGGHISVYSEPGRGTTFKIYLPQVEAQIKNSLPCLDASDLPSGTETILLVEDDPALREMVAKLLRRLGYKVLAAANGIEVLGQNHERDAGHVDLIFTDVVMPRINGEELADRVRALYPHTKILFTSAFTENAIVHQGILNRDVALLQKPFTPSALAKKVREILDQAKSP